MWVPTHVQVTVQRASGLLIKGKNNTNDCFVTIALGKTKYQTSVKEKAESAVEWHEECELPIPDQGNTAEIVLTALHRNFLGVDEFLGRVSIPLNTLDIYERPKNRWYTLCSKPGQESKSKERGELEVKIAFTVKSGSLTDLSKKDKHKSSIGQLSHMAQSVGGSLLSIGSVEKRKGIKKFAKSIGSKMHLKNKKKEEFDDNSSIGSVGSLKRRNNNFETRFRSRQTIEDADPGVVSEDDDEFTFDDLSHKSSGSSLNQTSNQTNTATLGGAPASPALNSIENATSENLRRHTTGNIAPIKPPRFEPKTQDEWESKLFGKQQKNLKSNSGDTINRCSWESSKLSLQIKEEPTEFQETNTEETVSINSNKSPELVKKKDKEKDGGGVFTKFKNYKKDKNELDSSERVIIGGENDTLQVSSTNSRISNELLQKYEGKSREDMILIACELQSDLDIQKKRLKDLEDYLDDLLLRVMETTPRILQNPYVSCKLAHKKLTG